MSFPSAPESQGRCTFKEVIVVLWSRGVLLLLLYRNLKHEYNVLVARTIICSSVNVMHTKNCVLEEYQLVRNLTLKKNFKEPLSAISVLRMLLFDKLITTTLGLKCAAPSIAVPGVPVLFVTPNAISVVGIN